MDRALRRMSCMYADDLREELVMKKEDIALAVSVIGLIFSVIVLLFG